MSSTTGWHLTFICHLSENWSLVTQFLCPPYSCTEDTASHHVFPFWHHFSCLCFLQEPRAGGRVGTAAPRPRAKIKVSAGQSCRIIDWRSQVFPSKSWPPPTLRLQHHLWTAQTAIRAASSFQGLVKPFSLPERQSSCVLRKA